MSYKQISYLILAIVASFGHSFTPTPIKRKVGLLLRPSSPKIQITHGNDNGNGVLFMSPISDAEALLAKARALRQQAEADEHKLHSTLIEKKKCQNTETDLIIQKLFPLNHNNQKEVDRNASIRDLAKRIEELRLSKVMLERVVERLHEREISARGLEHVEPSNHHEQVKFIRVAQLQEEELTRVQGLIQRLIDAAEVIDEEYLKHEQKRHHVDETHWSRGNLSKVLKEKAHFLGREHEDEFKKRLEEFYEAARKKKDYESYEMR